jgi:hypothetical protein
MKVFEDDIAYPLFFQKPRRPFEDCKFMALDIYLHQSDFGGLG